MNNGNNGKNAFNFSGFGNFFKRQEAAAKAAATRRAVKEAPPSRSQPRRGQATAAAANVNMSAAAAVERNWGGEGAPVYGTNYTVARGANERPPRAVSRGRPVRGRAPVPTRRRNNERRPVNLGPGYGNNRRKTRNNRNKPASEIVAPGKKKSLYEQALYILEKQDEPLASNNVKRRYQISHYERQLEEFTNFLKMNPYNSHSSVISDAISVLEIKLGRGLGAAAKPAAATNINMGAAAAAPVDTPIPTGLFPKERTIEELLKIRDYMERRGAKKNGAAARKNHGRKNNAKSDNYRHFLSLIYESAVYHIQHLDPANDSLDALLLHSGQQFLDELAQNLSRPANRAPTPEEMAANELVDELADALAGTSMGPATFPNNNNL
jgi:hypothetical protein